MLSRMSLWVTLGLMTSALACGDAGGDDDGTDTGGEDLLITGTTAGTTTGNTCPNGSLGCACYPNLTCDADLECSGGVCVNDAGTSSTSGATGTSLTGLSTGTFTSLGTDSTSGTTDSGTGTGTGDGTSTVGEETGTGETQVTDDTSVPDATGEVGEETVGEATSTTSGAEASTTSGDPETTASEDPESSTGEDPTTGESTTGEELPLELIADENGWVSRYDNQVGVQGAWYTYSSPGRSDVSPEEGETWVPEAPGMMCMSGTAGPACCYYWYEGYCYDDYEPYYCNYDSYWGFAGGLDLCAPGEADPQGDPSTISECAWADFDDVVGFRFDLTGDFDESDVIVVFAERDREVNTYVPLTASGNGFEALFEDAIPFDGGEEINVSEIIALHFQVSSPQYDVATADFCITDLEPILAR